MAAPNKKIFPLGLNAARFYKLNSSGYPDATTTAAYDGIAMGGPNVMTMDTPGRDQIAHPGNNGVLQYDSLPGTDPIAGTLTGSRIDMDTLAAVTGTLVYVEGESNGIVRVSDTEAAGLPDFALLIYRQAKQATGNTRTWNTRVFPSLSLAPQNDGMQRDRNDPMAYEITFTKVTRDITGRLFNVTDDGALTGVYRDIESFYRQHYTCFKADGTATVFNFAATLQAANTTDMLVYVNGVLRTATMTKAVTGITFSSAQPTAGQFIVVKYGLADAAIDIE